MDHSTDVHEGPNDSSYVEPKVDCYIIFPALKYIGRRGCCMVVSNTIIHLALSHPYQYLITNILGLFIQSCMLEGQTPKEWAYH